MNSIKRIADNIYYKLFVFVVIMPITGMIISNGRVWEGILLIMMQIPWFLKYCAKEAKV